MKRILLFTAAWFFSQVIAGQTHPYSFQEIGFGFSPPPGYTLIDSTKQTFIPDEKQKIVSRRFQFGKDKNYVFFSLIRNTGSIKRLDTIYRTEMKHFVEQVRLNQPRSLVEYDTSTIMLDSQLFHKLVITGTENGQITYRQTKLYTFYKDYRLQISWNNKQEEEGAVIEKAVNGVRFSE
ncbi:MAG TPA: hypothetical protein PLB49_08520 [Chitinophagaceae bacterium]|nr:hypothetical protein [Chitinophagaceae bacterium]